MSKPKRVSFHDALKDEYRRAVMLQETLGGDARRVSLLRTVVGLLNECAKGGPPIERAALAKAIERSMREQA